MTKPMPKKAKPIALTVLCRCVLCRSEREIGPMEEPVCEKCLGPMYALRAKAVLR